MITEFSFGRIVVEGQTCNTDIKIVQLPSNPSKTDSNQGHLEPDWWRKSGHSVEIDDLQDILGSGSEILVIGTGQPGYMRIAESLRRHLESKNIQLIEEPTAKAIQTFNRLYSEGKPVSAGFHVGC